MNVQVIEGRVPQPLTDPQKRVFPIPGSAAAAETLKARRHGQSISMRSRSMATAAICAVLWAAPGSAGAAGTAINVGTAPVYGGATVFYAQEEGFFKAAGLDVTLTVLNNGAALIAATTSGSVDIGFASPSPMILAHNKNLPVRYIAFTQVYTGPPPISMLIVAKDAPIRSGADLNDRRIAVSGLHDIGQYEAEAWIDRNGGDSSTVQFVELPYPAMAVAIAQGRVAAAAVSEPYGTAAKSVARVLGNLNEVLGSSFAIAGWMSTDGWLQRNPELAARFIAVIKQAGRWANAHPKEAAVLLARFSKVTPDVAALMVRMPFDETARADPKQLQPVINLLSKYGKLPEFNADDLVWSR